MALSNSTDPAVARERLTAWLAERLPDAGDVRVTALDIPSASGLSYETILFDAAWRDGDGEHEQRLVARVQPVGSGVFPAPTLATEHRVLQALGATAVPVPRVRWYDDDPAVLGAPFVVMDRVDGRVPADDPPFTATGWVLELEPERQAALVDNALTTVAGIHAVDWRAAGLADLARPDLGATAIEQQIGFWQATFDWTAEGEANPTVEAGLAWVREHRPTDEERLVLNWGDARIGNMLFADDLSVAAVLDWEMVCLASPELELGWWLFLLRHHSEGIGLPLPPGFPDREATIARYEQLSGHRLRHVDYYETFAALRLSILMHRAAKIMIAAGLLPPDAPMRLNNPASQLLARFIGHEAPTGDAQSFIGNRG